MPNSAFTILGFDFGLRRIGVAVGQTLIGTASPLQTLHCVDGNPDWKMVSQIITEWCPAALVVGLPLTADGTETSLLSTIRTFIRHLEKRYQLPVYGIDEHLSSREAESRLVVPKNQSTRQSSDKKTRSRYPKEAIDSMAAQVILQTWLAEQKF